MLFLKKTIDTNVIGGHSDKYYLCNQLETFGSNYDYVVGVEIEKDDWYRIKSYEDNRYKQGQEVLKNSLDFARILINSIREKKDRTGVIYDKNETKILKKPDEVFDMELKLIGNDEILEYLRSSLKNVINYIESGEQIKYTNDFVCRNYLVHFLNSLRETTNINGDNIEVLYYDNESSKDLILNDYYLTFLLLNGIISYLKENVLKINNDLLLKYLTVGENEYENLIKSLVTRI